VEALARKKKLGGEGISPASLDELQIAGFIAAVDLIADHGQAKVVEMYTNLVHAARAGLGFNQ
jgi:hypothetical protein